MASEAGAGSSSDQSLRAPLGPQGQGGPNGAGEEAPAGGPGSSAASSGQAAEAGQAAGPETDRDESVEPDRTGLHGAGGRHVNRLPWEEADPETGAWAFELEGRTPEGPSEQSWEGAYYDAGGEDNLSWYDEQVSWAGHEPVQEGTGWYGDEYYQDEYTTGYARSREEALAEYNESYGTVGGPQVWDEGDGARPSRPTGRASGPWPELVMISAVAVIIAAVILAVTSANRVSPASSQAGQVSTPSVSTATRTTAPKTSVQSTVPTTRPPTTRPKVTKPPQALALTAPPGIEQSLVRSWLATNPGGVDLTSKDVAGTVPGQVFYAEQPATHVYWAVVGFQPSAAVLAESPTASGQAELAQFQDTDYVFNWKGGALWDELGYVSTGECPGSYVPTAVLAAWGLCGLGRLAG